MAKKIRYKIMVAVVVTLVIIGAVLGSKWYSNNQNYNDFVSSGNKAISEEEYDDAIALYEQALKYKNDSSINTKIELAKIIRTSKDNYNSAIKQINDKEYLNAIDLFKKVDKQDNERYKDSQSKIQECKKQYITQNIKNANDSLKNSKFDDANNYLNNIFKIDTTNADALKIKNDIAKAIQNQKDKAKAVAASKNNSSKILSVEDAIKLIREKIPNSIKNDYTLVGEDTYVTNKGIKSKCYLFTEFCKEDGIESDSTIWVDKYNDKVFRIYVGGSPVINY